MNNEASLASLSTEPDWFCEDIVTIVFGIRTPALWKSLDQVKSQCIPGNCHQDFLVLNRMLHPFRGFLICLKPRLLILSGSIDPRPVDGEHEVPTVMFDPRELEHPLILETDALAFLSLRQGMGPREDASGQTRVILSNVDAPSWLGCS
jgi:hypothetical protein